MRIPLTIVALGLSLVLLSVNAGHPAGGYKGINKVQATDKGADKGADKAAKGAKKGQAESTGKKP
jgi:hypothetical protein